jgi:putative ABC transport system permease protein
VDYLSNITIQVSSADKMDYAFLEIEKVLRRQHRLRTDKDNDFNMRSQTDILTTFQETQKTFTYLLAGIAAVSLLVGGIGIMNIMLVSVTERTKEIGTRKAIGAKNRDVLFQFLIESVVLSTFGGMIGVLFGFVSSFGLSTLAGWQTVIGLQSILLSFLFAAAVGVFFGYYPARRAALLNPIDALRYE